jgi:hypothetical protein
MERWVGSQVVIVIGSLPTPTIAVSCAAISPVARPLDFLEWFQTPPNPKRALVKEAFRSLHLSRLTWICFICWFGSCFVTVFLSGASPGTNLLGCRNSAASTLFGERAIFVSTENPAPFRLRYHSGERPAQQWLAHQSKQPTFFSCFLLTSLPYHTSQLSIVCKDRPLAPSFFQR